MHLNESAPTQPVKIGVLLVNLGTPDAPTTKALRRYLAEFLSDKRVIELNAWLWQPLLHGVILNIRPRRSAKLYRSLWTEQGSPIFTTLKHQCQALQQRLADATGFSVKLAMRYGNPSLDKAFDEFQREAIERIIVLPLYPQYTACTTASTFDKIAQILRHRRNIPELIFIRDYHQHCAYIAALVASVREHWHSNPRGELLLMSFHGIPRVMCDQGDPYQQQCLTTAQQLAQGLDLKQNQWRVTFQSRFGPKQWLQPYTDATLQELARSGTQTVDVICPGFSADCLETLEEIAVQNRAVFTAAGGERMAYIPALNVRPDHVEMMYELVLQRARAFKIK